MGKLIKKEILLAMHPTALVFLLLSAMLLIPNYPYEVIFFYTSLGVYFICLTGRENRDIPFTMLLPIRKRDVVKARFALVMGLEILQMAVAVPFAAVRQHMGIGGNVVGMDANIPLFGIAFVMLGVFHLVFFGIYYKEVQHVGKAFLVSSAVNFLYIGAAEVLVHILPFLRERMDTPEPLYLGEKILFLLAGAFLYLVMTLISYSRAVKDFEKQDIFHH